jgi:hypothetical protein
LLDGRLPDIDAVIEVVPDLMRPSALASAIASLQRWFPRQDAFALLQKNPRLLSEVAEADLAADPTYGEISDTWYCQWSWFVTWLGKLTGERCAGDHFG